MQFKRRLDEEDFIEDIINELDSPPAGSTRGVSDMSDTGTTLCMIDYADRGKQYDDLDEGYNRNVQAVREFQREDVQWGGEMIREEEDSLHVSQGDNSVYVIDDANLMLEEEFTETPDYYRPSDCTVITNNRVSAYMPSLRPVKRPAEKKLIKCSKESMMLMQDLDSLAEGSEENSQSSQYSTVILPTVRNRPSNLSLRSNDSSDSTPRISVNRLPPVSMNRLPPHLPPAHRKL